MRAVIWVCKNCHEVMIYPVYVPHPQKCKFCNCLYVIHWARVKVDLPAGNAELQILVGGDNVQAGAEALVKGNVSIKVGLL